MNDHCYSFSVLTLKEISFDGFSDYINSNDVGFDYIIFFFLFPYLPYYYYCILPYLGLLLLSLYLSSFYSDYYFLLGMHLTIIMSPIM